MYFLNIIANFDSGQKRRWERRKITKGKNDIIHEQKSAAMFAYVAFQALKDDDDGDYINSTFVMINAIPEEEGSMPTTFLSGRASFCINQ